jgi:gliding motility-associated-like protein
VNLRIPLYEDIAKPANLLVRILGVILLYPTASTMAQVPGCTSLNYPFNGEADVPVSATITWDAVANANAYSLFIGTSPGTVDIVDGTDLGNTQSYTPPSGWDANTTYYIRILPRNNSGFPVNCTVENFTTGEGGGIPGCAILQEPADGAYGVAPGTAISWFPQNAAAGYFLSIGTSTGNYDLFNGDVGNITSYTPEAAFPMSQRIYVKILPYNDDGDSPECSEDSFLTHDGGIPACTDIIDPQNGSEFVSVTANITWIRNFNATGYRMTIEEKFEGGLRILDNVFVGTGTNYKPPNFLPHTRYYITLTPFNDLGDAVGCSPITFVTGSAPDPPDCTGPVMPADGATGVRVNTDIQWDEAVGATGYILSVGTSAATADIVNREDVGFTTSYSIGQDLPEGSRIFIRVVPYSEWGEAESCPQWSFTTRGQMTSGIEFPVPKFFTPNNDGFNDTWIVRSTPDITVDRVMIFNRFGKMLKQIAEGQPWDGNYNGRPLASDSYWYLIETTEGPTVSGFFLLKR